jgi:hypothetical protein
MTASHVSPDESPAGAARLASGLGFFVAFSFFISCTWLASHWEEITGSPIPTNPIQQDQNRGGQGTPTRNRATQIAVSYREHFEQYDDVSGVLSSMGEGYAFDHIPLRQLAKRGRLSRYRVLFLGCAAEMAPPQPTIPPMLKFVPISILGDLNYTAGLREELVRFVTEGGALYASDWASTMLQLAFPKEVSIAAERFPAQRVQANVLDRGLSDLIGTNLDLNFDTDLWVTAEASGRPHVYLQGSVVSADGSVLPRPLLISLPVGKGQIIFTSFHNEKQLSEKEKELLKYLVLKPIVAGAATASQNFLTSQSFTVQKESLFSTGSGTPREFPYTTQAGQNLTFLLSWNEGPDATDLELRVTSPSGKAFKERGTTPPVKIVVSSAEAGEYKYSVNPITVPYTNFPYVVSVGVKQ